MTRYIAVCYPGSESLAAGLVDAQRLIVGLVQERLINSGVILSWQDRGSQDYREALDKCTAMLWVGDNPPHSAPLPVFTDLVDLRAFLQTSGLVASQTRQEDSQQPSAPRNGRKPAEAGAAVEALSEALAAMIARGLTKRQAQRVRAMLIRFITVFAECAP